MFLSSDLLERNSGWEATAGSRFSYLENACEKSDRIIRKLLQKALIGGLWSVNFHERVAEGRWETKERMKVRTRSTVYWGTGGAI